MARLNLSAKNYKVTHEGAPAVPALSHVKQLRRSVMSCLLWEDQFYEDGVSIADRISQNASQVTPQQLAEIAIEARDVFNLRHVPLLLLNTLTKTGAGTPLVSDTIARVLQRADEMGELLAVYWSGGHKMVSAGLRKGLAKALTKFDEYQLAKYDRDGKVKLRDVLRVARPTPANKKQSALWKRVKERTLKTPDTWEVELSAGKDKAETFTRLIKEGNLGYLALLRNLRNMVGAGVDLKLIEKAILDRKNGAQRVYPFRYVAAARAVPQLEPALDMALQAAIGEMEPLKGKTIVLVDVSGSMENKLSGKSDMTRMDAGATLASIIPGNIRVFSFSNTTFECPPRKGMAGVDAIRNSQNHGGTMLGAAVAHVNLLAHNNGLKNGGDRLIVITDEQSHDFVPDPVFKHSYMINVASFKNGVGYGKWVHLDGFSENVIRFIREYEDQR